MDEDVKNLIDEAESCIYRLWENQSFDTAEHLLLVAAKLAAKLEKL